MGRKKKNIELESIGIEAMAAEGNCIARYNGQVIFVPDTAPGDVVDLRVIKKRKNYMEGRVLRFHHYSTLRTEPFCQHFDICGGCRWQHLEYEVQLQNKQQQVVDALQRIGKVALPPISPIIGSEKTRFYRNKMEYTASSRRWLTSDEIEDAGEINRNGLGFHLPGRFDRILDIEKCHLQPDPSNAIRLAVRDFADSIGMEFYDAVSQQGHFRGIIIRTANTTGQLMVMLQFKADDPANTQVLDHLKANFPEITALFEIINPKKNDSYADLEPRLYHGLPYIEETMEDLRFRISPKAFYQTNSEQAYTLYKVARDFAGLQGQETVYDLYTGTGTIANFVARKAVKVVGIEYVPEAIEDAHLNSEINKITNTTFFAGDMKDLLTDAFVAQHGRPEVVITDPPRAGMHEDVVKTLLRVAPERIVYVSCNPATQARDLNLLDESYQVMAVQPVDMFPHTHHVENVVLLEKRK